MGEQTEIFRAIREHERDERRDRLEASTARLVAAGVDFSSHNDGQHLIVSGCDSLIDFWPSTGRARMRSTGKRLRGIDAVLEHCEATPAVPHGKDCTR